MGSQMGKTAGLLNVIGHRLDDDPAPIIYIGPTRNNIDNVIEPKLTDLIKACPVYGQSWRRAKKLRRHIKELPAFR